MTRGRPRKQIDLSLVSTLRAEGLTVRAIAERIGDVSYSRVYQEIKKTNKKTSPPEAPAPASVKCLPNITPPPPLEAHNTAFSLAYSGKQPVSSDKLTFRGGDYYRFEYGNDVVYAHKNRILVWVNGTKGPTPEETEGRARGRARAIIGEFAQSKGITPLWSDFGGVSSPHFTVEDKDLNAWLLEQPEALKAHGLKTETTSHRKKVQADIPAGRATLEDLLDLPEAVREMIRHEIKTSKEMGEFAHAVGVRFTRIEAREDRLLEALEQVQANQAQVGEALREIVAILDLPGKPKGRAMT